MKTYELLSPAEVLAEKLIVWQLRAKHATSVARREECYGAISDLTKRIAALEVV